MRAVCWHDKLDVRVENVPEPKILNARDAIVRVRATAICGSDLHLYGGFVPGMVKGDILGHEFMGEVVDGGEALGLLRLRHLRLFASARRLCRRPGRIRARALRRRRADEGAGGA